MQTNKSDKAFGKGNFRNAAGSLYPVARGSLALVHKPCANPNCPACKSGEKHPSWIFGYVARLRKDQNREVRTAREKPFGNDTPSSKITFKPDAEVTRIANRGGATKGHEGHGRKRSADAVDETVAVERPQTCDRCGEQLVDFKVEERTVRIAIPPHYRTLRYRTRSVNTAGAVLTDLGI